jgi:hypothetical protein
VSDLDSDASKDSEGEHQLHEPVCDGLEFEDTELEQLVMREGPQQILQLTLQQQTDRIMKEEAGDSDDYADWIKWVADAERKKQAPSGSIDVEAPALLQVQQLNDATSCRMLEGRVTTTNESGVDSRWNEICQKIKINPGLDELKRPLLWKDWKNTGMCLLGIRESLVVVRSGNTPSTRRDLCPVEQLLDDYPIGRRLK